MTPAGAAHPVAHFESAIGTFSYLKLRSFNPLPTVHMDYERLKAEVKEIASVAADVPEQFRERCFDILLKALVDEMQPRGHARAAEPDRSTADPPVVIVQPTDRPDGLGRVPLPAQMKVFMQRTGVTEDQLNAVVAFADGEVHFIREPTTQTISQGQIEWSLLLALRNAILNNAFNVDPEAVRSICQEKGFYDRKNFASYFKRDKAAKLFREPLEPQGEAQTLTADGQSELGRLVKAFSAKTE